MRKAIKNTYNLTIYAALFAFLAHFAGPIEQNIDKVFGALDRITDVGFGKGRVLDVGNHPFY